MEIREEFVSDGNKYSVAYVDADSFAFLPQEKIRQVYGICFNNGKLLIGQRSRNGQWGHLGGTVEPGETMEETLRRELQEEANVEVLKSFPIGYQKIEANGGEVLYQVRFACSVRPLGPFVRDPDGSERGGIKAIQFIDPKDHGKFVHWGAVGDQLMERALDLQMHNYPNTV